MNWQTRKAMRLKSRNAFAVIPMVKAPWVAIQGKKAHHEANDTDANKHWTARQAPVADVLFFHGHVKLASDIGQGTSLW